MTSFIELPRLTFHGQPKASLNVNVADIVCFGDTDYVGQINVTVRELGSEGVGTIQTYVPLQALLEGLRDLAKQPGVLTWSTACLETWSAPVAVKLAEAYARERADWKQGVA